jgi:arylsulfatase A-like enzyme
MYRNGLKGISLFLILLSHLVSAHNESSNSKNPNIIVILSDDLGFGDPVCYGGTKLKTPNIDRLASEGIRFTSGYAPAGTCTPSRYALLTGEYAWRKKISILPGDAPMTISKGTLTMPLLMQQNGYTTGCVGKWHLGLGNGNLDFNKLVQPSPNDVGFDYSFIYPATNDRVPCVYVENGNVFGLDPNDPIQISYSQLIGDWPTGRDHPELLKMKHLYGHDQTIVNGIGRIGYMTGGTSALWKDEEMANVITGKAVNFIRQNSKKSFFLYFATHSIHEPRVPGPAFKGSSECGVYGDVIQELDWSVGEILKTLDELNLEKNTMIVFISDNGPKVQEGYKDGGLENLNGHQPSGILRGEKNSLYEGGTRIPFIVKWPARIKPSVSDAPVNFIDLFASFSELLRVHIKDGEAPDSRNALQVLFGKAAKSSYNEVLIQNNGGNLAIRKDDWKFIPKESLGSNKDDELYDLSKDISETRNVASQNQKLVESFRNRILEIKNSKGLRK